MDHVKQIFAQFRTIATTDITRASMPAPTPVDSVTTPDVPAVAHVETVATGDKENTVKPYIAEIPTVNGRPYFATVAEYCALEPVRLEDVNHSMSDDNLIEFCIKSIEAGSTVTDAWIGTLPEAQHYLITAIDEETGLAGDLDMDSAGDTGKETEMSNEMIETCGELFGNAAECVQEYRAEQRENSSIDPITECAYPIAQYTTTCGNDSVTELVGDAAVQYAGNTGKETVMTDERLFACTNPSIAQDYLTCKGEMTFTEAYGLCGEMLDEAYINGCCETFADDCQQHERAFQQDAERYAEEMCDRCLAAYPWDEDAASGSCSQECGGGEDLGLGIDDDNYVGYLHTADGSGRAFLGAFLGTLIKAMSGQLAITDPQEAAITTALRIHGLDHSVSTPTPLTDEQIQRMRWEGLVADLNGGAALESVLTVHANGNVEILLGEVPAWLFDHVLELRGEGFNARIEHDTLYIDTAPLSDTTIGTALRHRFGAIEEVEDSGN